MRFLFRTRKNYLMGRAYQEIATSVVGTYYSLTFCNIAAAALSSQNIKWQEPFCVFKTLIPIHESVTTLL